MKYDSYVVKADVDNSTETNQEIKDNLEEFLGFTIDSILILIFKTVATIAASIFVSAISIQYAAFHFYGIFLEMTMVFSIVKSMLLICLIDLLLVAIIWGIIFYMQFQY